MEQASSLLLFGIRNPMNLHRNAIYLTIEKAVHVLGGLLGMVMVARALGGDTLADYGFAISLTAFFIPFPFIFP